MGPRRAKRLLLPALEQHADRRRRGQRLARMLFVVEAQDQRRDHQGMQQDGDSQTTRDPAAVFRRPPPLAQGRTPVALIQAIGITGLSPSRQGKAESAVNDPDFRREGSRPCASRSPPTTCCSGRGRAAPGSIASSPDRVAAYRRVAVPRDERSRPAARSDRHAGLRVPLRYRRTWSVGPKYPRDFVGVRGAREGER
jgi:hypothetical protein